MKKIKDGFFHCRVASFGGGDGALDNLTIFLSHRLPGRQVCSINRKTSDGLAYRARQRLEGEIAIPSVFLGKPIEHVTQHIDVVGQGQFHDLQFFGIQQVAKRD